MTFRQTDFPSLAAAKASISAATAYRFEYDHRLRSDHQQIRGRRRPDPLADFFETEIVPMLEAAPALRAVAIFEEMQRIAGLYAIEATIRGPTAEVSPAVRAEQSAPVFADLRGWMEKTLPRVSGKSDLAGAIRYVLSRWDALSLVLRDGRACIDNNAAERAKLVKVPPA